MAITSSQLKGRINVLAKQNNADPRLLMRMYMMNHFLERLSVSSYKDNFIIKGGILVTSMVGISMRSTMNIDTSIKNLDISNENIQNIVTEITNINIHDGISFEIKRVYNIMDSFEYPGVRVGLDALMDKMITPFKIDISTGDIITPSEIKYSYNLIIEDKNINLWTYNLETILAEKLQTVLARDVFNTIMRDFYDIYTLMSLYKNKIDNIVLSEAFQATSNKRKSKFDCIANKLENLAKNTELQKLWKQYQAKYFYASSITFEDVMECIKVLCKKANIF